MKAGEERRPDAYGKKPTLHEQAGRSLYFPIIAVALIITMFSLLFWKRKRDAVVASVISGCFIVYFNFFDS